MGMIVAICGMAGAGKSTVREIFEKEGFQNIHLGVTEDCMERYGHTNEALERELREQYRKEMGMAAMMVIALPRIEKILNEGKNVVIDNMYSWSEYKVLKEKYGDEFITVAVHAKPQIRYERLAVRTVRPLTNEEARSRDYAEVEQLEKGGPLAMADYHIINESSDAELHEKVGKVIGELKSQYSI